MKRKFISIAAACLCIWACSKNIGTSAEGIVDLEVESSIYMDTSGGNTRSTFTQDMDRISELSLALYEKGAGALPAVYHFHTKNGGKLTFALPDADKEYTLYAFANFFGSKEEAQRELGEVYEHGGEGRTGMEDYVYRFEDMGVFQSRGFPMSGMVDSYSVDNHPKITLTKLISTVNLRIRNIPEDMVFDPSAFSCGLRQCVKSAAPFKSGYGATSEEDMAADGDSFVDRLTTQDIAKLLKGETVVMYLLENMQGNLLPDNRDIRQKTPQSLGADKEKLVSYFEISADYNKNGVKLYEGCFFRFCLGLDTTGNFDVPRNHVLNYAIDFHDIINDTGWYVEMDDPTQLRDIELEKTELCVMDGIPDMLVMRTLNRVDVSDLRVEVILDSEEARIAGVYAGQENGRNLPDDRTLLTFPIYTDMPIDGYYRYGINPQFKLVHGKVVSADKDSKGEPYVCRPFVIKVYNKLFPIRLETDDFGKDAVDKLYVSAENPMKLGLSFGIAGHSINFGRYERRRESDDELLEVVDRSLDRNRQLLHYDGSDIMGADKGVVNITVSPLRGILQGGNGQQMRYSYPQCTADRLYMGENSRISWGPDPGLLPQSLGSVTIKDSNSNSSGNRQASYPPDYRWPSLKNARHYSPDKGPYNKGYICLHYNSGSETSHKWDDSSYMVPIGPCSCISESNSNGTYREIIVALDCNTSGLQENITYDFSSFRGCPFYFINGGMCLTELQTVHNDAWSPFADHMETSISGYFLAPGRDLYNSTFRYDDTLADKARPNFLYQLNDNSFGKIYTKTNEFRSPKAFLTINGCSAWPGGSMYFWGFRNE